MSVLFSKQTYFKKESKFVYKCVVRMYLFFSKIKIPQKLFDQKIRSLVYFHDLILKLYWQNFKIP